MRLAGNSKPELTIAARTRSRASRTALSASPTTVNAGSPRRISASTHTRRASTPSTANVVTRASIRAAPSGSATGAPRESGAGARRWRRAGAVRAGSASEGGFQVVEANEGAGGIEEHRDPVEAQLSAERAVRGLGEPGDRHPADLGALG